MRPLSRRHVLLFGAVLAAALFVALFPVVIFPRQLRVEEGDIASRTIRSPRDLTFESELLTEQAREAAAREVEEVLEFDSNIGARQIALLATATSSVAEVRANDALDESAKRAELSGIQRDLGVLSRRSIDTILGLSDGRWREVEREADDLLTRELSQAISSENVGSAQDSLLSKVSTDFSAAEAEVVADLVRPFIAPTQVVNEEATAQAREEARRNVEPELQNIAMNQVIVEEDQRIDATSVEILEHAGLLAPIVEWQRVAAVVVVGLLASVLLTLYLWLFPTDALAAFRRLLLLIPIIALPVLVATVYFSLVLPEDNRRFLAYFLPLATAPMLVAALVEARLAIIVGLVQAALLTFAVASLPELSLVATIGALDAERVLLFYGLGAVVGVLAVHRAERPDQYVLGGVLVGIAALATLFATWLLDEERRAFDAVWMTAAATASGLGSGLLTAGGITTVGALLGITTRPQLMELSQLNAPLLRRLQDEAPGTFHHSIIVGNMAERAADLIGADALLVRVGCYYHDIGKILQPGYYIENQLGGANPHDGMDPKTSARFIAQHVRAGQELARRHGLPPQVEEFILEHHGTRLVAYFYRVASERDPAVEPDLFRYPGPKPQSRETAIVMLADSTEATVRASADRSPERIDAIVDEVMADRLAEGELEQCDLTLRNLRTIAQSFKLTLRGVYHPRIEYPEPTAQERSALIGRFRPGRRATEPAAPGSSQRQNPT